MKVLIIPEDQTQDGFIAKPILEGLFGDLEIFARVDVLPEPRLRGASDALNAELLREILTENPMTDLFILVVDRDCNRQGNEQKAAEREREFKGKLLACVAIQEIEVWLLALFKDELGVPWKEVRAHCDPKERFAEPLLLKIGATGPGGGRKKAMRALKGNLKTVLSLCEELRDLRERVRMFGDPSGNSAD